MSRIHILPDPLVSQIAAGEVVERPASVVKELLENALDAGATRVEIDLEGGGRRLIRLVDDGSGMGSDDALLAFDRHATSKILSFDDLERIGTLGFRGEALASIASVAKVEVLTAEEPGVGTRVRVEGGRIRVAEPATRPRGTTVEVRSLFWNVPARAKFLKSGQTELRRALEVAQGYILARPEVSIVVRHEGRLLLEAPAARATGEAALRERVRQVFGALADQLVALPGGAGGGEEILGFIGRPSTARGRRSFTFVNRRLLRDRQILAAFYRAVRDEWRSEDFPALFLFLDLPPEEVDVNVHPQKAEVRFREPAILDRLYSRFRAGLEHARGEEAAGLRAPRGELGAPLAWQGGSSSGSVSSRDPVPVSWRPFGTPSASWGAPSAASEVREATGDTPPVAALDVPWRGDERLPIATFAPPHAGSSPLSGRFGEVRPFRVLGQYKGTLILLEGPDGLYLIDQHVAHERILYERVRRALLAESTPSQHLISPVFLELAATERLRLEELAPALATCGFELVPMSGGTLGLSAIPAMLSTEEAEALLVRLASEVRSETGDGTGLRRALLEALAASLACKAAVKMHHPLGLSEMQSLIGELFAAEQPYACPHGRPVVLQLTDSDLERRFGRRG